MSPVLSSAQDLKPCYFFYGEETFLSHQFIQDIVDKLFPENEEDRHIERFKLEEKSWGEILDIARTLPFFASRRLIVIEVNNLKTNVSSADKEILTNYFKSSSS